MISSLHDVAAVVETVAMAKVYSKPGSAVKVEALRGVDLEIPTGQYTAICGASGSGKSTLMNILGCLDRPTTGQFILGGQDVSTLSDDDLADIRCGSLGFVFQSFNLIAQLDVLANIEVPLFYQGIPSAVRHERAMALAERVGIADRRSHRPAELSGGQQQRVAIARALINDPLVILADEPTGNLDSTTGQVVLELFDQLHADGKTILMVTHDDDVAARCQRVVTLRDGKIISDRYN
jgi:putative ABC transport system ATP-binding protein